MSLFDIKFDGEATKTIISAFTGFFKNQPSWLIVILACTLVFGSCYYFYEYKSNKQELSELEKQVNELSELTNNLVNESEYKKNLLYFIEELKLLEYILEQNYQERIYEADVLINCAEKHFPNDPMPRDLRAMEDRIKINYRLFKQHHDALVKDMNKLLEGDSIKVY